MQNTDLLASFLLLMLALLLIARHHNIKNGGDPHG